MPEAVIVAAGPAALVGTAADGDQPKRRIYQITNPPLLVSVRERLHGTVRLLEFRA